MKKGLLALTVLGVAAAVAHHQFTAQDVTAGESSPIHLESAETVRAEKEQDLSKVPVNQMTVIDMRILLKKLESEAIDRLDRTELQKRLEDELSRQAEQKREARLEAISKELSALFQENPASPTGKRAQAALNALTEPPHPTATIPTFNPATDDLSAPRYIPPRSAPE